MAMLGTAHHNVGQPWRQVCMPERTTFSGDTHQLQLLLRVAATQVQLDPTQEQTVLVIQHVGTYAAGEMH